MQIEEIVEEWLAHDPDPNTRFALKRLLDAHDLNTLRALFAGRLSFGTAGLRAEVGPGPLRMNCLVVRQTTAGLAQYLAKTVPDAEKRGIVVGCDARIDSTRFASEAVAILLEHGFIVHHFQTPMPTPVLAFAVRDLGASAGIVITASHNPSTDNGIKVYWGDGAQVIPPHDTGIAYAITAGAQLAAPSLNRAQQATHIRYDEDSVVERAYIATILGKTHTTHVQPSIAYSPLHGVGGRIAQLVLQRAGFSQVHVVASQIKPNGRFPGIPYPNPEYPEAFHEVVTLADQVGADLALANDPDADRLAVGVRDDDGNLRVLTGNQIGVLLADYVLGGHTNHCAVGTTIVSSRMLSRMAEHEGADYFETLTGFKWLAAHAAILEKSETRWLFAYEEALGYGLHSEIRDKDGISALLAFAQLTARCMENSTSPWKRLGELYLLYGMHITTQITMRLERSGGEIMQELRTRTGTSDFPLLYDYRNAIKGLPTTDLLEFCAGDTRILIRPSGTEPILKCYAERVVPLASDDFWFTAYAEYEIQLKQTVQAFMSKLVHVSA